MEKDLLVEDVITNIIEQIQNTSKDVIFLQGNNGSGKTTIINEISKLQNVINITINYDEKKYFINKNIQNIYHILLIIKKIILYYININNDFKIEFLFYYRRINNLLNIINIEYIAKKEKAFMLIVPKILNIDYNELLEELLDNLSHCIINSNNLLILDDFDLVVNNINYQNYIYNKLKNKFRVLYAINNNHNLSNNILNESQIITIEYNYDDKIIEDILDKYSLYYNLIDKNNLKTRIRFVISNNNINKLINITNGNINLMKQFIYLFYENLNVNIKLNNGEYLNDYNCNLIFENLINTKLEYDKGLKRVLTIK